MRFDGHGFDGWLRFIAHSAYPSVFRLGRRTNSPPQFGQVLSIASLQGPQKVHS
jgi:hypothetical protein